MLTQEKLQEIGIAAFFGLIIGAAFAPYFLDLAGIHLPVWIPGIGGVVIGVIYAMVPKGGNSQQ